MQAEITPDMRKTGLLASRVYYPFLTRGLQALSQWLRPLAVW